MRALYVHCCVLYLLYISDVRVYNHSTWNSAVLLLLSFHFFFLPFVWSRSRPVPIHGDGVWNAKLMNGSNVYIHIGRGGKNVDKVINAEKKERKGHRSE